MKQSKLSLFRRSLILAAVSILFTLLVLYVDRRPVGPLGSLVGMAFLNKPLADAIGFHTFWYGLTQGLGLLALAICAGFAGLGLWQWITRKSLKAVDLRIILLGGLYTVTICLYLLFNKLALNYRPLLMPGETEPEASFPSSHCMLIVVVMGACLLMADHYLKASPRLRLIKGLCLVLIAVTVLGRLLSGVHWFTDIIAGVLISLTLLSAFKAVVQWLVPRK